MESYSKTKVSFVTQWVLCSVMKHHCSVLVLFSAHSFQGLSVFPQFCLSGPESELPSSLVDILFISAVEDALKNPHTGRRLSNMPEFPLPGLLPRKNIFLLFWTQIFQVFLLHPIVVKETESVFGPS